MDDIGHFDISGKWISENPENFKHWLKKNINIKTVLKVKRWYQTRSLPQNNYMHYVFDLIAKELGYEMADMKGYYKLLHGIKKTSELTTVEQEDFMSKVRIHAQTEFNILVPLPNEIIYE